MVNKETLIARREEILNSIRQAARTDAMANEGGEGYSQADALQDAHLPELKAIDDALFLLDWTPDVIAARKEAWNEALRAAGERITMAELALIEKRLGFTRKDVLRVKALTA